MTPHTYELTDSLSGGEHDGTADRGEAAEGTVQAEVACVAGDHAAEDLGNGTHAVGAARADAKHHFGTQHAANEHPKQMPVLRPGDEDVTQTDQIELHDQRVKAGHVLELLALAAGACELVQHITLIIADVVRIAGAVQVARVTGVLRAGIQLGGGEDDAGHEPCGGYLAQKDDEYGA